MKYQPKGGMCAVCEHVNRDCSNLEFENMIPITKTFELKTKSGIEAVKIVKCDEFKRG